MKHKVGHLLAVACGLACLSFSISCTSTEDGSEDASLDASMTEAESDDSYYEDERAAALAGEGSEEVDPSLENDPAGGSASPFEQGPEEEAFDASAESAPSGEFDPFANSGAAESSPAEDSSDSADPFGNVTSNSTAEPEESTEAGSSDTPQGAEADPFARFDGLITSDGESTEASNDGMEPATGGVATDETSDVDFGAFSNPSTSTNSSEFSAGSSLDESSSIRYLVAPGDSLYEIANRIYGNNREWMNIAQANSLSAPFLIYPGDELEIPAFGAAAQFAQAYQDVPETVVTVQAGDSLYSIAKKVLGNGSAWKYIWKSNQDTVPNPNLLSPGQVLRFKDYRSPPQASL